MHTTLMQLYIKTTHRLIESSNLPDNTNHPAQLACNKLYLSVHIGLITRKIKNKMYMLIDNSTVP